MSEETKNVPRKRLSELKNPKLNERVSNLVQYFEKQFQCRPIFIANVPGRVNLIGEHVDYCGYPVMPMAIEQSILVAVSPDETSDLTIVNVSHDKYEPFNGFIDSFEIQIPTKGIPPKWHNYFLCGVKGILDQIDQESKKIGMKVAVFGNVPPASGLSSSSALVSAATLVTSVIHSFSLNKEKLANISADCECYIGTQGGGMDQAIAFLAVEGCAQFIEWNPLKATPIALPPNTHFVIANSLSIANKAATSDFNQRVVECRLACRLIAKELNQAWHELERFALLQQKLNCSLVEFEALADRVLSREIYTRGDVIEALEISETELDEKYLTPNTKHLEKFKLRQRALHVIQESIRVSQFRWAAARNESFGELSKLMRESHRSLQENYECSHENLDRLVQISDEFGVSARLTGAGWGGCIVAICKSLEHSLDYINCLKSKYFQHIENADVEAAVFVTSPQKGAEIFLLE